MLLICSAWQEEVRALDAQYCFSRHCEEHSASATKQSLANFDIATLGIGYLNAALKLKGLLSEKKYSKIIFLGTAGAYAQDLQIGDVANVVSVTLLNSLAIDKRAYVPKEYEAYRSSELGVIGRNSEAVMKQSILHVNCLSSLEITTDETLSQKIIERSLFKPQLPLVENMELYGVAKVASEHNIPWSALLGITNYTNANAHQDWKVNHEWVSEKLSTNTNLLHSQLPG